VSGQSLIGIGRLGISSLRREQTFLKPKKVLKNFVGFFVFRIPGLQDMKIYNLEIFVRQLICYNSLNLPKI